MQSEKRSKQLEAIESEKRLEDGGEQKSEKEEDNGEHNEKKTQ